MVCAHWSFRFMVLMPFNHEIGTPQWSPEPAWVEEEERKWEEEEEEFRMCPWRYRPGAPRKRVASVEAADKAARRFPGEVGLAGLGVGWMSGRGLGGGGEVCSLSCLASVV